MEGVSFAFYEFSHTQCEKDLKKERNNAFRNKDPPLFQRKQEVRNFHITHKEKDSFYWVFV